MHGEATGEDSIPHSAPETVNSSIAGNLTNGRGPPLPSQELERLPRLTDGRIPLARYCWSSAWRISVLITAWRLMFNSLAAWSSSSNMPVARSTFTLWIGPIICPLLVKNRDTSFPWSARRAMASAAIGLRGLRVFFIQFLLLLSGFPESYEMVIFSVRVLAHLKNDSV